MADKETFLWHDYETWGTDPAVDRPCQFAAIRTDNQLNEKGKPVMIYARPMMDMLPVPEACLVTGLTPQQCLERGVIEPEFIGIILDAMKQPATCSAGYNNIRFDDEFTRYTSYRNFHDPYEREWKNGNSRWDLIDVVRLCSAVRPEGINWPQDDEGMPSYKLEALTAANGIEHSGAHDALADVRATIAMARLIRDKQPKLFDYALGMRNKHTVSAAIALNSRKPVLHISGMFGNKYHCASVILPLCMHPVNKNAVICIDLRESPEAFIGLGVEEIQRRVFTSQDELGEETRIPLKSIHINKCPMVAPVTMVDDEVAARIGLDIAVVRKHYDELMVDQTGWMKARDVFKGQVFESSGDPETMLYSGGFFSDADKRLMQRVRESSPDDLRQTFCFEDSRLPELLFRYRARHYPQTLSQDELAQWQDYRFQRLVNPEYGASITMEVYQQKLDELYEKHQDDSKSLSILEALMSWGDSLLS